VSFYITTFLLPVFITFLFILPSLSVLLVVSINFPSILLFYLPFFGFSLFPYDFSFPFSYTFLLLLSRLFIQLSVIFHVLLIYLLFFQYSLLIAEIYYMSTYAHFVSRLSVRILIPSPNCKFQFFVPSTHVLLRFRAFMPSVSNRIRIKGKFAISLMFKFCPPPPGISSGLHQG
jgi:hypothetical protein